MMEDEEEFALLKINSPSSHIALSGDLEISIAKMNQTLDKIKYKYEFKEEDIHDAKSIGNISNDLFLLR